MMVSNSQALAPYREMGNTSGVVAKSTAGIGTPFLKAQISTPKLVTQFFVIKVSWIFIACVPAHPNYGGLGKAASAGRDLESGSSNLVQFTTFQSLEPLGGDVMNHLKEAIMPEQISLNEVASTLHVKDNHAYVTSNELAQIFNKNHQHVIRDIESLDCSEDFALSNFGQSFYKAKNGQTYKNYHITRDGFAFLAMGFTGKKAAQFKEAYIQAFNQMEQKLHSTPALPEPQDRQAVIRERIEAMLDFDTSYLRILISVEKGKVTMKRILSQDELVMNRERFINYFKAPDSGFTDLNQLIELSAAVNDRICRIVQPKEGKQC